VTEAHVLEALRRRYAARYGNGPRWAFVPHARNGAAWGDHVHGRPLRTVDALAVALWPSDGLEIVGHEVKVRRSDWLREVADPSKADGWRRYCDRWYVVAAPGVVRAGELPEGWGGMVAGEGGFVRTVVSAPPLDPEPLPRSALVALVRAACRRGALGGEDPLEDAFREGFAARAEGCDLGGAYARWRAAP
jgi:hypothetical protein